MPLHVGMKLGPYEIVAPIGAGGMGEVYRARDLRLKREVAIKVLPKATAGSPDALARFQREAEAVAALSHPNILAIYDFGTDQGITYIVMELLEGETLRERLTGSALPWRKAIEIGLGVADGLAAAHAKGIVHRDLKPENIFLTADGVVKILDFGLARAERTTGPEDRTVTLDTRPGTVLGTVNYMSPEQVRGEPLDARTDIFSLGCVLYEMVTGQRAFSSDTSAETMTAILNHHPPEPAASGARTLPELDQVITRCLEKTRAHRFQSSNDLAFTLRNIQGGSTHAPPGAGRSMVRARTVVTVLTIIALLVIAGVAYQRGGRETSMVRADSGTSLAVLPLELRPADPEQEYFADAMTDELITSLAKISALRVTSPTSIWRYKGTHKMMAEIGRELNDVGVIVTGSVMRAGERVRITVRLIEVVSDRVLWTDSYDRGLDDVLAMQSDLARTIALQIQVQVTPAEETVLDSAPLVNPKAHDAYMRGQAFVRRGTKEDCRTALRYFDRAIEIDPEFALPHAGRAQVYRKLSDFHLPPHETQPYAKAAAMDALALDANLAEAHAALGQYLLGYAWEWSGAEASFRRAMDLNPSLTDARLGLAGFLTAMRRDDEAIAQLDIVRELDPAAPYSYQDYGGVLYATRRFDRAIRECRAAIEVAPEFWPAHMWLGWALGQTGEFSDAIDHLRTAWKLNDESTLIAASLGGVLANAGQTEEAKKILADLKATEDRNYVCPYELATISIGLGDHDEAFAEMHRACDGRAGCMPWLQVDARLDPLRFDPRFDELLRCVGFEPAPIPSEQSSPAVPGT